MMRASANESPSITVTRRNASPERTIRPGSVIGLAWRSGTPIFQLAISTPTSTAVPPAGKAAAWTDNSPPKPKKPQIMPMRPPCTATSVASANRWLTSGLEVMTGTNWKSAPSIKRSSQPMVRRCIATRVPGVEIAWVGQVDPERISPSAARRLASAQRKKSGVQRDRRSLIVIMRGASAQSCINALTRIKLIFVPRGSMHVTAKRLDIGNGHLIPRHFDQPLVTQCAQRSGQCLRSHRHVGRDHRFAGGQGDRHPGPSSHRRQGEEEMHDAVAAVLQRERLDLIPVRLDAAGHLRHHRPAGGEGLLEDAEEGVAIESHELTVLDARTAHRIGRLIHEKDALGEALCGTDEPHDLLPSLGRQTIKLHEPAPQQEEMSRCIAAAKENLARPKGACLGGSEQPPALRVIQSAEEVVMAQLMRGEGIYPHGAEVTSRLQALELACPPSCERPSPVRLEGVHDGPPGYTHRARGYPACARCRAVAFCRKARDMTSDATGHLDALVGGLAVAIV